MKKLNKIILISMLFIIFFIININSYATSISQKLSDTFFRLHILANSNSEEDQELKLKVRDEIIKYMETIIRQDSDKKEIINICEQNLESIKSIAKTVILENGYNYDINVTIGNFEFPTKYYGNISLPAGNYDALKIEIGDAVGKNWWCSLFPALCFIDISSGTINSEGQSYLEENLSTEELSIVTGDSKNIKLKFKIIEILNRKNML